MPKETRKRSNSAAASTAPKPVVFDDGVKAPTPEAEDDDTIVKLPPIPIDKATGKIAFDRMHGATKEKVNAMLAANTGATNGAASGVPMGFVHEALRTLNGAITITVGAVTKAPKDIVLECTTFSESHLERLGPPSHAMLTKYAPKLEKVSVEIEFGMAFYNVVQEMILETRARAEARKATPPAPAAATETGQA